MGQGDGRHPAGGPPDRHRRPHRRPGHLVPERIADHRPALHRSPGLARARTDSPADHPAVLAGHARTLAARFETHRQVILRFTTDLAVGFTNNAAERQVRPVKVQQRSSGGCWRTLQGLADFAIVQFYLSTAGHWGITRVQALDRLFNGDGPWIPTTLTPSAVAA